MNAFASQKTVEARSLAILTPWLRERAHDGRFVVCGKGALAYALQERVGDALINTDAETLWSVELKADDTDYPRFFFETWSNKNLGSQRSHAARGSNPGWLLKSGAGLLLYHRLKFDELCVFNMLRLKRWAFGHGDEPAHLYEYRERLQAKSVQANDTWGRCVPLADVKDLFLSFSVSQLTLWDQGALA